MLIKRVRVRNIRSHRVTELKFKPGVTVLSGDIGSGKTSILYAIDFALFGLRPGELSGEELLRATESRGMVEVDIEVDGRTYTIGRSLERIGENVRVERAWIIYPGGNRKEYSSSEARAVIVKLLRIPEEVRPTTHTRIFRTALYIPQNELTRIIEGRDVERREEIIMRLFDLDKYRIARENLTHLIRDLNRDKRELEAQLEILGDLETELREVEDRISTLKAELEKTTLDYKNVNEKVEGLRGEKKVLETKLESLQEKYSEISRLTEKIKALLKELDRSVLEVENSSREAGLTAPNKPLVEELISKENREIAMGQSKIEELKERSEEYRERINRLEGEIERLRKRTGELEGRKSEILKSIREAREKLEKEGICPLCRRPVTREHIKSIEEEALERIRKLDLEAEKVEIEISRVEAEKKSLESKVKSLQEEILQLQTSISNRRLKIEKLKKLYRDLERLEKVEREVDRVKGEIKSLGLEFKDLDQLYSKLKSLKLEIEKLKVERRKLENEESKLIIESSNLKSKIEADTRELRLLRDKLTSLRERIREKEELKRKLEKLASTINWVEEKFRKALERVEREATSQVYYAFVGIFKQLTEELLGEAGIRVEVDSKYTPIVFQDLEGREAKIQLSNLSGGEAASIALAYRLALNYVARYRVPSLKEGTLLLDEPSTGFSREQLKKFRDVLSRIGAKQVIIVTHEEILEDAADHIVRLVKRGGVSRVERVYSLESTA